MQRGRPWVRMKIAACLDGRTALDNGAASGSPRRRRAATGTPGARAPCAVLTGIGTVLEDNPRLDVRLVRNAAAAAARGGRLPAARRRPVRASSRATGEVLVATATAAEPRARALR